MMTAEPLILCVDDDAQYLRSLARSLTGRGYRVKSCTSASQALEAARADRPALAIVDVLMPGMDGLQLTARLAHWEGGPIPVVLHTGYASEETFFQGFFEGARYVVEKPCGPEKLLDVVDYFAGDLGEEERRVLKERL
ncbi:MAG TPA: response regulator [Planctomycetota bacterium]|nr:response regulator [Planctomycetota bacterium]